MNQALFETIDRYIDDLFVPAHPVLDEALRAAEAAGLPDIQVSPGQGKLLYLLAKLCGARRILEVGTLAGYSTIWLGRALPDGGRLITLEFDPAHADVARGNLARAGLTDRTEVLTGPALETLPILQERGEAAFDMVFLDADKANYTAYLGWSLRLLRPGGLILADNVIRGGAVLDPDPTDESALGARAFNAALAAEPRLESIAFQQIGAKGHDGLAMAIVRQ